MTSLVLYMNIRTRKSILITIWYEIGGYRKRVSKVSRSILIATSYLLLASYPASKKITADDCPPLLEPCETEKKMELWQRSANRW